MTTEPQKFSGKLFYICKIKSQQMKKIQSFLVKLTIRPFAVPVFFIGGMLLLLASCVKDYFDLDKIADSKWTPSLALPMVYSSLSINDLIKVSNSESLFQIDPNNFVTLVYKGNLFSLRGNELIVIPDNSVQQNISPTTVDIPSVPSGATYTVNSTQVVDFNTGGQTLIDSLFYKSGTLQIEIYTDIQHDVQILLTIPDAKKSGTPFSQIINVNYGTSMPVLTTVDLSGYVFDMTLGGSSQNQFNVNYTVTINGIAGNPLYTYNYFLVTSTFKDSKFDKIFGYIGQQLLSPNIDTVSIGLFSNTEGIGTFTLVDAKIKTIISNSYGIPILANFSLLEGYRPGAGTFPVTGSGIPNPLPLPSPSISQIGQVLKDSFELNNTNSNAVQLVNFQPPYFIYQLNSVSNPAGQTNNFVIDSSIFATDLEIDLPLHGTAVVFTVQDTFDFEMPEGDDLDSLLLRIYISNGFPLEVGVQVYFVDTIVTPFDTLYHVIDSVLSPFQNLLTSAPIDANGKAVGATEKTIDQWFDSKKLKNMATSKKIFVRGQMTTSNNGNTNVKIYSDYKLDVKIGAMAKLKQNVSFH